MHLHFSLIISKSGKQTTGPLYHHQLTASCVQHLGWPQGGTVKPLKAHALIRTQTETHIQDCPSVFPHLCDFLSMGLCVHVYTLQYSTKKSEHLDSRSVKVVTAMPFAQHLFRLSVCLSNFQPTSWRKSKSGISQSIFKFVLIWMMKVVCFCVKTFI